MSSYNMLEKVTTRWEVKNLALSLTVHGACACVWRVLIQETGTWDRIFSHKCIVKEPRTGGKEGESIITDLPWLMVCWIIAFDEAMRTFYDEVAEAEQSDGTWVH